MSEIGSFPDLKILISELKTNIESRRNLITHYKELIKETDFNSRQITINRYDYENLLDEFQFTITQSLQAIKSLEIENLNYREVIDEINHRNTIENNQVNTNFGNNNTDDNKKFPHTGEDEQNSNIKLKSNNEILRKHYTNNYENFTLSNMEEKLNNTNEGIRNEFVKEEEKKIDYNNNYMNDKFHENILREPKIDYNFSYDHDIEEKEYPYKKNIHNEDNKNEAESLPNITNRFKLNFDYSVIKDYKSVISSTYDLSDNIKDKIIEDDHNIREIEENLPNYVNHPSDNDSHTKNQDELLTNKDMTIKEGLRHRIKNQSNPRKNTLHNNFTIKNIEDEEEAIQKLNSKKMWLQNDRIDHRDKIFILNLLNKINNDDKLKEYFAYEYGDGNYEIFLIKLNNNQLNLKEVENFINFFTQLRSNSNSNRNNGNRCIKYRQDESVDSKNSKRNYSKIKENNKNEYIEPIRFENFLRFTKSTKSSHNKKYLSHNIKKF